MLKVALQTQGLKALQNKLKSSGTRVEHAVAQQVARDTNPYVPMKNGVLANSTQVRGNQILYTVPYAHYLYEGVLWVYPDTGSAWAPKGKRKVPTGRPLHISTAVNPKATSHWVEASKAQNLEKWERFAAKEQLRELR